MSVFTFLSENLVDDAGIVITAGAENAQFPLTNIQNESPSKKFRSVGNTLVLEFDFTQTRDIDTIALVGDNLTGLNLTSVVVKTSVNTDFSGSPANVVDLDVENNWGFVEITEVSHRFAEVSLTGNGSFSELSNIFIGKREELDQNGLSIGSFNYRNEDRSTVTRNRYGQRFIDQRNLQKTISGTIEFATKAETDVIDTMILRHGRHLPLWILVDKDDQAMIDGSGKLSAYGYLERTSSWRASGGQLWSTNLQIEAAI